MGKSFLDWYVIDNTLKHDKNYICFDWDYEPEKDTKHEEMFDVLKDNEFDIFTWSKYSKLEDKLNKICPLCLWYYEHCHENVKIILDYKNIRHSYSYSNLILISYWYIDNLYIGKDCKDYDKSYGPVKIIDNDAIEMGYFKLYELGKPKKENDKNAYEETIYILEWAKNG